MHEVYENDHLPGFVVQFHFKGQFNSGSEREIRDSDSNSNRLNTFEKSMNQSLIRSLSNGAEGAVLS